MSKLSTSKKIVDRYYEHRDTIMLDKLGQIVSDIYLSENPTKTQKLWQSAATALEKLAANSAAVRKVLEDKNVEGLARLIGELTVRDKSKPAPSSSPATGFAPGVGQVHRAGIAHVPSTSSSPSSPSPAVATGGASPAVPAAAPSADQLKMAMKAFRKRLKLTKLDDESRVGRSPLSGGQRSGVMAIEGPREYPLAVWEALAEEGKLSRAGRGFYQLGPKA